jgi:cellulose synthase/poly-beta-1,6-N-acetylglucosamine synthase-like glycosyltransferase
MSIDVSIVIPIKDSSDEYVSQCIDSLKKQDFFGTFEILVVEGGNRAQARNLGIKLAKGKIIAFIDSDCVAPLKWLNEISNEIIKNPCFGGIGGANISPSNVPLLGKAIDLVFSSFIGSLGSASLSMPAKPRAVTALACINSAYKKEILQCINGFDEEFDLCEDTNLSYKVRDAGYKLLFVNNLSVWHYRRDTIRRFAKQFFLYGVGRMRSILTNKKYSSKGAIALLLAALSFPFLLYFLPLFVLFELVAYLLAISIVGVKGTAKTGEKKFLFLIPYIFIVEHFSYLFGLFYGLVKGKWTPLKNVVCSIFCHLMVTSADNKHLIKENII